MSPRWAIHLITDWDPVLGEGDEVQSNVDEIEAETAEEAETLAEERGHGWYASVHSSPAGTDFWGDPLPAERKRP